MPKKDNSYFQKLTDKIAKEGGLQTDLSGYHNPIQQTLMQGEFLRGLKHSNFSKFRKIFALFYFIIPSVSSLILILNLNLYNYVTLTQQILVLSLGILYITVGLILFLKK